MAKANVAKPRQHHFFTVFREMRKTRNQNYRILKEFFFIAKRIKKLRVEKTGFLKARIQKNAHQALAIPQEKDREKYGVIAVVFGHKKKKRKK